MGKRVVLFGIVCAVGLLLSLSCRAIRTSDSWGDPPDYLSLHVSDDTVWSISDGGVYTGGIIGGYVRSINTYWGSGREGDRVTFIPEVDAPIYSPLNHGSPYETDFYGRVNFSYSAGLAPRTITIGARTVTTDSVLHNVVLLQGKGPVDSIKVTVEPDTLSVAQAAHDSIRITVTLLDTLGSPVSAMAPFVIVGGGRPNDDHFPRTDAAGQSVGYARVRGAGNFYIWAFLSGRCGHTSVFVDSAASLP